VSFKSFIQAKTIYINRVSNSFRFQPTTNNINTMLGKRNLLGTNQAIMSGMKNLNNTSCRGNESRALIIGFSSEKPIFTARTVSKRSSRCKKR